MTLISDLNQKAKGPPAMKTILNFIDGQFLPPQSQQYLPNFQPATGIVYGQVPDSDDRDVNDAVSAAEKAFPAWSKITPQKRGVILRKIGNLILENLEELALDECWDTGKPLSLARTVDIPRSAANFHFFADALTQFSSEAHPMYPSAINYTLRMPLGVVGLISPWNLPLYLLTWKVAPALAAGNCVVAKPSELTPMTAMKLSKISLQAGLPPGVLNIIHGKGPKAGEALTTHPRVAAISFTGGTKTGSHIASKTAPSFKKLSLELGGKNPNIIFSDCDFANMMDTTLKSSFSNQGQICLSGSRIFVEKRLYLKFKEVFIERTRNLKLGNPLDPKTEIGALISKEHMEKVLDSIHQAQELDGKILTGGKRKMLEGEMENGWYVSPTIIEGSSHDSPINQEEVFGPVVTLIPFNSEKEVLSMANGTPYGLAASLWTSNVNRAHSLAEKLHFGMVWVNCWMHRDLRTPFGGQKQSGVGREGGWESLKFFTEPKNVCIKYS